MSRSIESSRVEGKEGSQLDEVWFEELAKTYMVVFGNAEGLLEGGVNSEGDKISLGEFLGMILSEDLGGAPETVVGGIEQKNILSYLGEMESGRRELLEKGVQERYGYSFFYKEGELARQFREDLTTFDGSVPVVVSWEMEREMVGFSTSVVVMNKPALGKRIERMDYLTKEYGEVMWIIEEFLDSNGVDFPIMLDLEAGVMAEFAGREKGGRWNEILYLAKKGGRDAGANRGLTITYEGSGYYKGGKKKATFIDELRLEPRSPDGEVLVKLPTWVMVLVDLNLAVEVLEEKLARDSGAL